MVSVERCGCRPAGHAGSGAVQEAFYWSCANNASLVARPGGLVHARGGGRKKAPQDAYPRGLESDQFVMNGRLSVVFSAHFEVGLTVTADGADFRGLRADDEVAADAAFPHAFAGLFEDLLHLDVLEELEVAFLVGAFDGADGAELGGEFGEAFLFGVLGELDVHVGPFVVFAFSGGLEVGGRGLDAAEGGEPQAGVFLFVAGRRQEDFGELLIAFALGDFGEVRIC